MVHRVAGVKYISLEIYLYKYDIIYVVDRLYDPLYVLTKQNFGLFDNI